MSYVPFFTDHDLQDWISRRLDETPQDGTLYKLLIGKIDKAILTEMNTRYQGNQTKMALALGVNRGTLRKKMKACGFLYEYNEQNPH